MAKTLQQKRSEFIRRRYNMVLSHPSFSAFRLKTQRCCVMAKNPISVGPTITKVDETDEDRENIRKQPSFFLQKQLYNLVILQQARIKELERKDHFSFKVNKF